MKVWDNIDALPAFENTVVTIGTFDGVHLGHQKVIGQLQEVARSADSETVIITFHPHPRKVVMEGQTVVPILTTLSEKIALLASLGIDHLVVVPFNALFAAMTAEAYITGFLVQKFHPRTIIIGYDHRFGHDRKGDYRLLEAYGLQLHFEVQEIPQQVQNEIAISSTKIRKAILGGDIATANACLGYAYFFEGEVVKGNQLGRTIGFPTANLQIDNPEKLIPANGVYAVEVQWDKSKYRGMMNIGIRPTVGGLNRTIEVHILDFDADIYGKILQINVVKYLRGEVKFAGLDALKEQLAKDKENVRRLLP